MLVMFAFVMRTDDVGSPSLCSLALKKKKNSGFVPLWVVTEADRCMPRARDPAPLREICTDTL
eukprot:794631-Prymnesium_polylepis.2